MSAKPATTSTHPSTTPASYAPSITAPPAMPAVFASAATIFTVPIMDTATPPALKTAPTATSTLVTAVPARAYSRLTQLLMSASTARSATVRPAAHPTSARPATPPSSSPTTPAPAQTALLPPHLLTPLFPSAPVLLLAAPIPTIHAFLTAVSLTASLAMVLILVVPVCSDINYRATAASHSA